VLSSKKGQSVCGGTHKWGGTRGRGEMIFSGAIARQVEHIMKLLGAGEFLSVIWGEKKKNVDNNKKKKKKKKKKRKKKKKNKKTKKKKKKKTRGLFWGELRKKKKVWLVL